MTEATNPRKIKTPPFRMSFPSLLEPREDEETKRKTYQLNMFLPPGVDLSPFKAALVAAMEAEHGTDKSKWPKLKRGPAEVIRDFAAYNADRDKPLAGEWAGWTLIRAGAGEKYPPSIVGPIKGADGKFPRITDAREVYGGRWARATIEAYFYDHKSGGKGVTFGLLNVQLLKHDDPFGKAVTAPEADFENASEEWAGSDGDWGNGEKAPAEKSNSGDDWN
jgi:hypothetical protein